MFSVSSFDAPAGVNVLAGFSGETLHGVLQEPLDKIRVGRLTPEAINIRMLLVDTGTPWALPCRAEDLADDPDFREHKVTLKGVARPMYDLMGKDAVLFQHTINDDDASIGSQYVEQARAWFDSIWTTISHQPAP